MSLKFADEAKPFMHDKIPDHEQSVDFAPRTRDCNVSIRLLLFLNAGFLILAALLLFTISANLRDSSSNPNGCFDG
jgi:hypothetical protein